MTAETARMFQALEEQAQTLLGVFVGEGYEAVAPSVIQPAEVFLDVVGEDLRGRTYVFTDPEGAQLCLRPDLTIPTCRLHWERHGRADATGRYCYNGSAFRFQPDGADSAHPREFRQAGIEHFGVTNKEAAETEVLKLVLDGLRAAGLDDYQVRIGDLGLFGALLEALEMPTRWRTRLRSRFWRPAAFQAELEQLRSRPSASIEGLPEPVVAALRSAADLRGAERAVVDYLDKSGIEVFGARSIREISTNLMEMIEDAQSEPLDEGVSGVIESYLGVKAPARAAGARLEDLMQGRGIDLGQAIESYQRRLSSFAKAGIDIGALQFSAEFGRNLEYYTGFVFEVIVPALGERSPVAGGGRYDKLMRAVGADVDVPAVGAMIHTERLLATVQGAQA
ncbi:MAG TPA: ATP phosphoribosyltransferase regulatory subunit [Hyphomicrobiaceae bacterium]|nr:ATP phosphoribosyltransferase regulatory subunit [Hyphomicrobiaceae bacterium]